MDTPRLQPKQWQRTNLTVSAPQAVRGVVRLASPYLLAVTVHTMVSMRALLDSGMPMWYAMGTSARTDMIQVFQDLSYPLEVRG